LRPRMDKSALRELIVATVGDLLNQRLVTIGTVSETGFAAWTEPIETALRLLADALAIEDEARWGFVAWLCNTHEGDARARDIESSA
jgi:hypothetical protein